MNRRLLLKSVMVNGLLVVITTLISLTLGNRAENFGDLVFIAMMLYGAGALFLGNIIVAVVQAFRGRGWIEHAVMSIGSVAILALVFFITISR